MTTARLLLAASLAVLLGACVRHLDTFGCEVTETGEFACHVHGKSAPPPNRQSSGL